MTPPLGKAQRSTRPTLPTFLAIAVPFPAEVSSISMKLISGLFILSFVNKCVLETPVNAMAQQAGKQSQGLNGMDLIIDGWFHERGELWKGQAMSLEVKKVIHHGRSNFQDLLVFESTNHGTVLVLDGVIQVTERDEFSYQEMLAHIPLFSHPNPEKVLVIGGGDGGIHREVAKHPGVKEIIICEIDGDVIDTDSSDPIGPASVLFETPFYNAMHKSLRDGGIVCTQGECIWLHLDLISPLIKSISQTYRVVEYCFTTIPTYPSGQIGFIIARKGDGTCKKPARTPTEEQEEGMQYYSSEVHEASFVLPAFAKRAIFGKAKLDHTSTTK